MYDDRRLLETRVRRLASPRIYSQEPRSRTSRTLNNVTIERRSGNEIETRSKFIMVEFRRNQQRLFAGTSFHKLIWSGGFKIASKRVDILNCDAPLDGLVVPF
jgi:3-phenylpropionate/cinnamic acid dioxygenase small subunit